MSEPNEMPLNLNEVADQSKRSPNFVGKITNSVRNVTNYLQSNRTQAQNSRFWGADDIESEIDGDAGSGTGQWATDGLNTACDDSGLITLIHISKKHRENHLQCTVCLDDFEIYERAIKLLCGHIFHEKCINHWFTMHDTCPLCRTYYCPFALQVEYDRVNPLRSLAQSLYRTIRSPLVYFFPSLGRAEPVNDAHGPAAPSADRPAPYDWSRLTPTDWSPPPSPTYRLERPVGEEMSTTHELHTASEMRAIFERYKSYHAMLATRNTENAPRPGPRDGDAAADPMPGRPESSQMPADVE